MNRPSLATKVDKGKIGLSLTILKFTLTIWQVSFARPVNNSLFFASFISLKNYLFKGTSKNPTLGDGIITNTG